MSVELSGTEKRDLKGRAQLLEPVVRIGNAGKTAAVVASLEQALALHELVKLKFTEFKDEKKTIAAELAEETNSVLIQVVGNVAIFYRPLEDSQD